MFEYNSGDYNSGAEQGGVTPVVRVLLITNLLVYIVMLFVNWVFGSAYAFLNYPAMAEFIGFVPNKALERLYVWQFFTYAFVHDMGPLHILLNMFVLWWVGTDVERQLGRREFIWLYALSIVAAAFCYTPWAYFSDARGVTMVGASGAIMSLLVVFAMLFPDRKVYLLIFGPFSARMLVGILIFIDVALVMSTDHKVAAAAHLGGAIFGYAYIRLRSRWEAWMDRLERKLEAKERAALVSMKIDLDKVLKKIHDHGMESLSKEEKAILNRASKHYREGP